jgi:AcrR family transcriptional regulator
MTAKELESKREVILKTAREMLAKYGFAKLTLDDIAGALGMKKSSLYYYYENKEALLDDVMRHEQELYTAATEEALAAPGTTFERLVKYEKAKFAYIQNAIKLHEMSTSVLLEIKNKMITHIRAMYENEIVRVKKVLDEGVKAHEIKKCNTRRVAELMLIMSEALRHREFYYASFHLGQPIDLSKASDEMVFALELMFNGLSSE